MIHAGVVLRWILDFDTQRVGKLCNESLKYKRTVKSQYSSIISFCFALANENAAAMYI
jgi:hypothetical protein